MRYKCTVAYDGFDFNGYQVQKHDKITIQQSIETSLAIIFKEEIVIFGSGRTDKHVHAYGQVFHFDSDKKVPIANLKKAMNSLLPLGIKIKKIEMVDESFHARFSSHKKVYVYKIINSSNEDVFKNRYYAYIPEKIDFELLSKAGNLFVGNHNFYAFTTNKKEEISDFSKTVFEVTTHKRGNEIQIQVMGSGFLKHQVRMMVGAMLVVATGKKNLSYIENLIDNDKSRCSYKAAPQGLYLKEVIY